jgi:uncharacterized RDD family membrane protein YckC
VTRDAHPVPPPVASGNPHAHAPLLRRLAALAYEQLLLAAIVLLAGFVMVPFSSNVAGSGAAFALPSPAARAVSAGIVFAVAGFYFAWSWTAGRRTLPMKTWGLALTRVDGRVLDGRTAAIRYAAAWIGPLTALAAYEALRPAGLGAHAAWLFAFNYLWAFVDPERQFLHDRIAGTRIVRR